MRRVLAILALLLAACASPQPDVPGTLVIVGGGLSDNNTAVWSAFVDAAKADGPIVIVPAASGYPDESARNATAALLANGVEAERIAVARIAVIDDPTTDGVDESEWRANASDPDTAALLARAGAVWFTGGDQSRITEALDGTPSLAAIREAHGAGAAIGGTSAGAAVMSDPMITGGFRDGEESEPLTSDQGLGFLPSYIVDQHFSERGRLWRLQEMTDTHPGYRGIGIDEDTAVVIRFDDDSVAGGFPTLEVLGRGEAYAVSRSGASPYAKGQRLPMFQLASLREGS